MGVGEYPYPDGAEVLRYPVPEWSIVYDCCELLARPVLQLSDQLLDPNPNPNPSPEPTPTLALALALHRPLTRCCSSPTPCMPPRAASGARTAQRRMMTWSSRGEKAGGSEPTTSTTCPR